MKKGLFILSAVAAASLFADTTVTTSNTLGFLPVSSEQAKANGMWLVSVPFAAYDDASAEVPVADFLQTANLNTNDKLFIPADDGTYDEYKLLADKTWSPVQKVTLGANGSVTVKSGTPAADATVARGKSFWVQTSASQINLLGEGVTDSKDVKVCGGTKKTWNLIGGTVCTVDVDLALLDGTKNDVIVLADGTQYMCASAKNWYKKANGATSFDTTGRTTDKIPAGVGFWYSTKTERTFSGL